jgi:lipid-A-disaccharide synthase
LKRIVGLREEGRIPVPKGIGVLIKAPKPNQDQRVDLPAIGPPTIDNIARAGLAGLAVVAGSAIIAEPNEVVRRAEAAHVFVIGVAPGEPTSEPVTAAENRPLSVFLVAGEESGDRLGSALMQALTKRTSGKVRFAGIGGHGMAEHGLNSLFPITDITIVGFAAIPRRLRTILRRLRETVDSVLATRPDVLIIIDSPDFTHRVARRVRALAPEIPIVDYVSPQVWAWRPGRARAMRGYVDQVLALMPFEPAAHARLGGPPCTYVGHPLIELAGSLRPNAEEARRRDDKPPVVLVMPGSRSTEINRLLEIFGATVALVAQQTGPIDLVLPTVPHLLARVTAETANWPVRPRIVVDVDEKRAAFRIARAALAASGTVTLELAVAGVPTVVAYKASLIEELIVRPLIKVTTIVLANLVLGEQVMPEFLQRQVRPEVLAPALANVIVDGPDRQHQLAAFARLDAIMGIGAVIPSEQAASAVMEQVGLLAKPLR